MIYNLHIFRKILIGLWGCSFVAQAQSQPPELVYNSEITLGYDEAKYLQVSRSLGLPSSVMMLSAQEMLDLQPAMQQISTVDFFKLPDWEYWESAEAIQYIATPEAPANDVSLILPLKTQAEALVAYLKQPLEAGRVYTVEVRYSYLFPPHFDSKACPPVGIQVFDTYPAELTAKSWLTYLPAFISHREETNKRKKVVEGFQQNYGGVYGDDFADFYPNEQEWETSVHRFKAKGGEQFVLIGYVLSPKGLGKWLEQSIDQAYKAVYVDKVSVRLLDRDNVRDENETQTD